MAIADQAYKLKEQLKNYQDCKVVAAVKYFDVEKTKEFIDAGITDLGETRKEEFIKKYEALKDYNITWHYLGVIKIPPKLNSAFVDAIDYLHSLDSIDLASAINKARKKKEPLKCFIMVNIANCPNKAGLDESKVICFVKSLVKYEKIEVVGLMTSGKYTYDEEKIASYFDAMVELRKEIQNLNLPYAPCKYLSMGMSNDYKIALEHGSNFIRLGSFFTK